MEVGLVMQMHLSLIMPNPGAPPSRPYLNFPWLLLKNCESRAAGKGWREL